MTYKERQQLQTAKTFLTQAQSWLTGQDKSWGMALERMTDAAEIVDEILEAKPRGKKAT